MAGSRLQAPGARAGAPADPGKGEPPAPPASCPPAPPRPVPSRSALPLGAADLLSLRFSPHCPDPSHARGSTAFNPWERGGRGSRCRRPWSRERPRGDAAALGSSGWAPDQPLPAAPPTGQRADTDRAEPVLLPARLLPGASPRLVSTRLPVIRRCFSH